MTENMISFYHTGCQICTALAISFLLLTVFLFLKFKIPALFFVRSGRAKRKAIKEIEENQEKTMPIRFVIEKDVMLVHSEEIL